jgi:hypothetical protein
MNGGWIMDDTFCATMPVSIPCQRHRQHSRNKDSSSRREWSQSHLALRYYLIRLYVCAAYDVVAQVLYEY